MRQLTAAEIEQKRLDKNRKERERRARKKAAVAGTPAPNWSWQKQAPSVGKVNVALVLDASGSMHSLRDTAIQQLNRQVENLSRVTRDTGQRTSVSLFLFSDRYSLRILAQGLHPDLVPRVSVLNYRPAGQTALLDAIKEASKSLALADDGDRKTSFLVVVVTDGQENDSVTGKSEVQELLNLRQGTDRWTFALLVPPGGRDWARSLGIPDGNVQEWETTTAGLERMSSDVILGATSYYSNTQRGVTSTKSFFTDLSKVDSKALKQLDDLTYRFKHWKVEREIGIRSFVEAHGAAYQIGSAYYQLTKTEKVQHHKDFVIQDKTTKKLYGGDQARDLIGIRSTDHEVRVNPGNHANYNLFVQSTSTNRKLVRGTTLLYKA